MAKRKPLKLTELQKYAPIKRAWLIDEWNFREEHKRLKIAIKIDSSNHDFPLTDLIKCLYSNPDNEIYSTDQILIVDWQESPKSSTDRIIEEIL